MNINELKKIAEKNEYELTERLEQYEFVRRSEIFYHRITISKVRVNGLWIFIKVWCDDKDFNMIKAVVEFAETPVEDREEDTKDKLLNEINRILNYVKDFDNKGLMEVLNGIEKLEDDLKIFANDLKDF